MESAEGATGCRPERVDGPCVTSPLEGMIGGPVEHGVGFCVNPPLGEGIGRDGPCVTTPLAGVAGKPLEWEEGPCVPGGCSGAAMGLSDPVLFPIRCMDS